MADAITLTKGIEWDKAKSSGAYTIVPILGKITHTHPEIEIVTEEIDGIEISELDNEEVNWVNINSKYQGDVLITNGQILEGGRQTRSSVRPFIIRQGSERKIPVNCIEQGRWTYDLQDGTKSDKKFSVSTKYVSSFTKSHLSTTRATQRATWNSIQSFSQSVNIDAEDAQTQNYVEIDEKARERDMEKITKTKEVLIDAFSHPDQRGVVILQNNKVLSIEVFENQKHWQAVSDKVLEANLLNFIHEKDETKDEQIQQFQEKISLESADPIADEESFMVRSSRLEGWAVGLDGELVYMSMYRPQESGEPAFQQQVRAEDYIQRNDNLEQEER